jgi:tetratricopeptide (TPR) repeat protein
VDKGFVSSRIDLSDRSILRNPRLPDLVLTPKARSEVLPTTGAGVPHAASRDWDLAIKQLTARNWPAAEAPLRAVVEAAPKFAPAWAALGTLCSNLGKSEDARKALDRAIELDPKPMAPYLALAHAQIDIQDWKGADGRMEFAGGADCTGRPVRFPEHRTGGGSLSAGVRRHAIC